MRKFLFGTVAFVAFNAGSAAMAADMGVYKAAPVAVYSWTGFYVGGDFGAGWGDPNQSFYQLPGFGAGGNVAYAPTNYGHSKGVLLTEGLHAGFNWQVTPSFLVGVEADFSKAQNFSQSNQTPQLFDNNGAAVAFPPGNFLFMTNSVQWLGTARVRVGILPSSNYLLYVTGGAAWESVHWNGNPFNPAALANIQSINPQSTATLSGWVAGAGVEYLVAQSWTVRAEYLFYGFPGHTASAACTRCNPGAFSGDGVFTWDKYTMSSLRVGVSYKFGDYGLAKAKAWLRRTDRPVSRLATSLAAWVGAFHLVTDQVGQRCFRDLARERRALAGPIPECAPKTMHGDADLQASQHHFQCHT